MERAAKESLCKVDRGGLSPASIESFQRIGFRERLDAECAHGCAREQGNIGAGVDQHEYGFRASL